MRETESGDEKTVEKRENRKGKDEKMKREKKLRKESVLGANVPSENDILFAFSIENQVCWKREKMMKTRKEKTRNFETKQNPEWKRKEK